MIKLISKTTLITLFICCTAFVTKAQLGYNFSQYDVGAAVGFNQVYGDAQTQTTTESIHFNFTYNQTPYTNFVFEVQLGKLQGGNAQTTSTGRQFTNDFTSFIFRGQIQAGEFIDYSRSPLYNALKNFYASAGIGYVVNRITSVNRYSFQNPGFYTDGLDRSNEPFIPIRIGYEFKIFNSYDQPNIKVDLGYGYNFILGDDLDGFSAGTHNDVYSQFTIGVKFSIGDGITSYKKRIPY